MFKTTKSTTGGICKKDNAIKYSRNMECLLVMNDKLI